MGRRKKERGRMKKPEESDYDSDDPRAYEKERAPDPSSREYMYDEVDEFHATKEKISLEGGGALKPVDSSEGEEEVLGWDEEEEEDEDDALLKERLNRFRKQEKLDEMASDLEDDEEEDDDDEAGPIGSKAWGKRKQTYYNTDYVDEDLPGLDKAEETANQDAEEQEALAIQTRMAQAMQDEDFGLDIFKAPDKQPEKMTKGDFIDEEIVAKDLSKLSKREKLEILKKESPEFLELVADFKLKMHELIDRLQPLVALIKAGVIQQGSEGAQYIHTKYQLYLSYCMNISFYMILKSRHIPVTNHPVIGRILAFRKLISELQPVDEKLEAEIESLLSESVEPEQDEDGEQPPSSEGDEEEETMTVTKRTVKKMKRKRKREESPTVEVAAESQKKTRQGLPTLSQEELKALEYYRNIEAKQRQKKMAPEDLQDDLGEEDGEDEKRGITYQISKNKGLTAYRRKELRNPRVKNRMKFRKAKIRRKGQVREPRTELRRYGGEASGIRAGVIKSIKIK